MEHPSKLLNQTLMCTSLRVKKIPVTKSPQVMMLVSIAFIKHYQLTCLSLDVSPTNKLTRMIGEKCYFHTFTKIENKSCNVIVDSESCINAISSRLCEHLGLEVYPTPTPSKCHGLTPRHLRSNNNILSRSISIFIKTISRVM